LEKKVQSLIAINDRARLYLFFIGKVRRETEAGYNGASSNFRDIARFDVLILVKKIVSGLLIYIELIAEL